MVTIAGEVDAGKRALADLLDDDFPGAQTVSFAEAVHNRAGGDAPADILRVTGQSWVESDPDGLIDTVLRQVRDDAQLLIINSVHHYEIQERLRQRFSDRNNLLVLLKKSVHDGMAKIRDLSEVNMNLDADVNRQLLSHADLILDASRSVAENALHIQQLARSAGRRDQVGPLFVDGYTLAEKRDILNEVTAEFELLLPSDIARLTGRDQEWVKQILGDGRLLSLAFAGMPLVPRFALDASGIRPAVAEGWSALRPVMSSWEFVGWLLSENGELDARRPVDVDGNEFRRAVQAELIQ